MRQRWLCHTYYVSRGAHTSPRDAVAVGPVGTDAQVSAALAEVPCRTGLVAVQARPSRGTGAFSRQGVAAERATRIPLAVGARRRFKGGAVPERGLGPAGAVLVTEQPVQARGAEAVLAAGALEALVAQTGSVDVVALGTVLAVTFVGTLWSVRANRAFVLASVTTDNEG